MKFQTLGPNKENTFVLVFDKGDEFISELTNFAKNSKLAAVILLLSAHFAT